MPGPVGANVDPLGLLPASAVPVVVGAVADETAVGDITVGINGSSGAELPTLPMMGNTLIVGTAAIELTPRLLISVESSGIPVRAAPPGAVGDVDVGVDDEATLLEPEPHIPDIPAVSIIPEVVDIPDVAEIVDDDDVPDVAAVAGAPPTVVPPPS